MTPYLSKSGKKAGVTAYQAGKDFIIVGFNNKFYKYTWQSCGKETVEIMKSLARASEGLSTFIARKDPKYEMST